MIKAAGDFAGEFNMGGLVLPHRHFIGAIDENVRRLQQGIAEKSESCEIAGVAQLLYLLAISGNPLQPWQGTERGKQGKQFGVLRHMRLHKKRGVVGVDAGGEPFGGGFTGLRGQIGRAGVFGGQRVPVGHKKEAVAGFLQFAPVGERAAQVAEVQRACGAHSGKDAGTHFEEFREN